MIKEKNGNTFAILLSTERWTSGGVIMCYVGQFWSFPSLTLYFRVDLNVMVDRKTRLIPPTVEDIDKSILNVFSKKWVHHSRRNIRTPNTDKMIMAGAWCKAPDKVRVGNTAYNCVLRGMYPATGSLPSRLYNVGFCTIYAVPNKNIVIPRELHTLFELYEPPPNFSCTSDEWQK